VTTPVAALSTSIAALINGAALVWLLRAPLDGVDGRHLLLTLVKTFAAAAAMAAVAVGVERWLALINRT